MRNELLKWLREEKQEMKDAPDGNVMPEYFKGCVHTLSTVIDKINSIPVPDVEGYLKGKIHNGMKVGIREDFAWYTDAIAALQSLAADKDEEIGKLKAEVERFRWIPVEERLPELGQEVNVLTNKGVVTSLSRFIRYEGSPTYYWDNNYGQGNTHLAEAITHWMPLPEPPKQ